MNRFLIIITISSVVFVSTLIQIFLKKEASKSYEKKYQNILNVRVLLIYLVYFTMVVVNVLLYKYVEMNEILVIESLSYIFIPVLSYIMLKERLNKKQLTGFVLIVVGIIVYSLS